MDSIYEIDKFFPIRSSPDVQEYIDYHFEKLGLALSEDNPKNRLETGVLFHMHILYMVFVYIQLLRIAQFKEEEFKYSLIGFPKDGNLKNPQSPFSFSWINEKTVFRFFRLIGFDDGFIGQISGCVTWRNELFHATGIPATDLSKNTDQYVKNMEQIVSKTWDFVKGIYSSFKTDNPDFFLPGYIVTDDDLETNFYIPFSISPLEVEGIVKWSADDSVIQFLKKLITD